MVDQTKHLVEKRANESLRKHSLKILLTVVSFKNRNI